MSIFKFRKGAGLAILILQLGCTKTDPFDLNPGYDPYIASVTVSAGDDIYTNKKTVFLNGVAKSADSAVWKLSWTKREGPAGGIIENPDSATTSISRLETGEYTFELKAMGPNNKTKVDRISVYATIIPDFPGIKTKMIDSIVWNDAMCVLPINDFQKLIPKNSTFQLYIRPLNSVYWNIVRKDTEHVEGDHYYKNMGDNLAVYIPNIDCSFGGAGVFEGMIIILP